MSGHTTLVGPADCILQAYTVRFPLCFHVTGFEWSERARCPAVNWEDTGMKRRQFLKAAGVGLAASTAVAAPAIAQSMPTIKWRMPTSWPKSLDTIYGGAEMMCTAVGEATDGKFTIQPFAGGEIVPGLQVVDAVQNGTVEIGHTAS